MWRRTIHRAPHFFIDGPELDKLRFDELMGAVGMLADRVTRMELLASSG